MIQLYTWKTPNGQKVSILLEETGLPYAVHPVNIGLDEQFAPTYVGINPNSKIPAIVDPNGPDGTAITVFESGAVLLYLAEKTGRFLPTDTQGRYAAIQWVMWQMAGLGPILGQHAHFTRSAKVDVPYAKKRFREEAERLLEVLDTRLGTADYVAGADYTVADMALYPWATRLERLQFDMSIFPNLRRWLAEIGARPAVKKGMAVPVEPAPGS